MSCTVDGPSAGNPVGAAVLKVEPWADLAAVTKVAIETQQAPYVHVS